MNKIYCFLVLLVMLSCNKSEVTPQYSNIEFSMNPISNSVYAGESTSTSLYRQGDYDFETVIDADIYISKDNTFSTDDILLTSLSGIVFDNSTSRSINILIPKSYNGGRSFIVAVISASNSGSTSKRYCSTSINVLANNSGITFTGISFKVNGSDTTSRLVEDKYITSYLSYKIERFSSQVFVDYYVSTDNLLDVKTDTQLGSILYYLTPDNYAGALVNQNLVLPLTLPSGKYHIIVNSYYRNGTSNIPLDTLSKAVIIDTLSPVLTVTSINSDLSKYSPSEYIQLNCSYISTLDNNSSLYVYFRYYFSKDQTLSVDDIKLNDNSNYVSRKSGNISFTQGIPSTVPYGEYFLLSSSYYNINGVRGSKHFETPTIVGNPISIIAPQISISGISFSVTTVDPGSYLSINSAIAGHFNNPYSYFDGDIYISTDKIYSTDDVKCGTASFNYGQATNYNYSNGFNIPSGISTGAYYVIIRYSIDNGTSYNEISTTKPFTLAIPSAVLFRNSYNANYSTLYLFIDDVYVSAMTDYINSTAPTCAFFSGSSYYGNNYYKFYASDGAHTYKLRTTNILTTGSTLFQDVFNASSTTCITVDVD